MTRTTCAVILISLAGLASACSASKEEKIRQAMGEVDPGEARVAATVVHIDTTRARRPSDPCAQHPCLATIVVDSVLAYGAGFSRPLSSGERVEVRFGFTLSPTAEALPQLDKAYPGLSEGDAFWADVRDRPAPGPSGERASFVIYDYYLK